MTDPSSFYMEPLDDLAIPSQKKHKHVSPKLLYCCPLLLCTVAQKGKTAQELPESKLLEKMCRPPMLENNLVTQRTE